MVERSNDEGNKGGPHLVFIYRMYRSIDSKRSRPVCLNRPESQTTRKNNYCGVSAIGSHVVNLIVRCTLGSQRETHNVEKCDTQGPWRSYQPLPHIFLM